MPGPQNSAYFGGRFTVNINFDEKYPFSKPKILFVTKMYHPNIKQESGDVEMENDICTADKLVQNIMSLLSLP